MFWQDRKESYDRNDTHVWSRWIRTVVLAVRRRARRSAADFHRGEDAGAVKCERVVAGRLVETGQELVP
jgi:hypothetical protein